MIKSIMLNWAKTQLNLLAIISIMCAFIDICFTTITDIAMIENEWRCIDSIGNGAVRDGQWGDKEKGGGGRKRSIERMREWEGERELPNTQ